jgi:carboxypeptidase Taq
MAQTSSKTRSKVSAQTKAAAKPAGSAKAGPRAKPNKTGNGLSFEDKLADLRRRLMEIGDLSSAGAVLGWDQATYMPKGGAAARARQGATLSRLAHEKFTDPALGKLLDGLAAYEAGQSYDSDDASLIRIVRRDYDKATKVPADFVSRWSEMGSASYDVWTRARPANDFATMRPYLEKALDFSRRFADYLGPYEHIADPLIDGPDEGQSMPPQCSDDRNL